MLKDFKSNFLTLSIIQIHWAQRSLIRFSGYHSPWNYPCEDLEAREREGAGWLFFSVWKGSACTESFPIVKTPLIFFLKTLCKEGFFLSAARARWPNGWNWGSVNKPSPMGLFWLDHCLESPHTKNPLEWLTGIDADELTMLVPLYQPLTLRNVYDTWYINIWAFRRKRALPCKR